jgi:hypothetical protein
VNARELIEILREFPDDTEVVISIVAPVEDDGEVTTDDYDIDGVLPVETDDGEQLLLLVGGEEDDIDRFLDALDVAEDEPTGADVPSDGDDPA